ncbi:nuclear receptor-interacting protein 1-like [Xyrauchen texanus]|uniref:nuclear receptor-interacting protein 1-like n=1 Tax=Xyrauchen texanus TaxID=154827 RepID=UPI002241973D|nr:nuclear receptor-interacting protein 1-like [Xyrauchen texanus]XP_051972487.1 nuclear receptor-interacting protein 1-like [Xyrauchen texanus]XP_051972488.1 nuclear receptor-interacting protein 1-like [Xyrauchen texanus]
MTHGVESGPETQQDSTALTYLEGLLMHPVTTGPAATATQRSEPDHNGGENANKVTRTFPLPKHGSPSPDKGSPHSATSQHHKKARLLRSEAWSEDDSKKQAGSVVEVNGRGLDGSGHGESTLLASLLQSFSSQLQSVALSQHISQSHKSLNRKSSESAAVDKETHKSYGTASGHLKSLMRKRKQQNHNTVPYCRHSNLNRNSDSPRSTQSSAHTTGSESMSCTQRLKAVANIVQTRSSPATSPKPSVACSQLALLLSSEVHLQQYSREQALKAQLISRSASEKLAAMATQQTQDKRPPSVGQPSTSPDMLSSLNVQNGALPPPALISSKKIPCLPSSSPKERRPFDRHSRPPQNCSRLLLLLLNNHNAQQQLTMNGHLEDDRDILPRRASSLQSDSDYSNQENCLTKDSSDTESFSSCSPIDLSTRGRVSNQKSEACSSVTSSLDKLTESLINKWKPEPSTPKVHEATNLDASPDMKSHDKVTLMQLLLERRNNKKVNKSPDNPGLWPDAAISSLTASPFRQIGLPEDSRTWSPLDWQPGGGLSTFSSVSPSYSYLTPHAQSSPLDLCKSIAHSSEKTAEPSFSASKLLQNLAQSGVKHLSPSPPLLHTQKSTRRRQSPELELDKSQAHLDRLVAPVKQNRISMLDRPPATLTLHKHEQSPLASTQVENLLEKRTVLQHLLGTASHKERPSVHRVSDVTSGGLEKPHWTSTKCENLNGSSLDLKIKMEPVENRSLDGSVDVVSHQRQSEQHSPISEAQDKIKSEQCPKETAAKFGLLSKLLKQQNATYFSKPHTELLVNSVKEESLDFHSPVPKKRKLCIEVAEHLSNELCQRSGDTTSDNLVSGTPEYSGRRLTRPREENLVGSPRSKAPPSRESQGFNVLKQLLLSENCLKNLSQPRGTPNPFPPSANRNPTQCSFSHELSNLPRYPYSLSTGPDVPKSVSIPTSRDSNGGSLLWAKGSPKASPKPVKKEPEGSPGELVSRKKRSSPDTPPFTRSNPILYYMLQRGNGQLRTEIRDQVQPAHCAISANVEPCHDNHNYEHRINSLAHRQSSSQREENLNGSVEKW